MPRQLRLDLQRDPDYRRESFVMSEGARPVVTLLDSPELWNGGALALVGPEGSGKTHLARDWAARNDALVFDRKRPLPAQLSKASGRPVLWDDADRGLADEALFHLINATAAGGGRLLLTGRSPPHDWPASLPDLRSRLNALTVAELPTPDDAVMAGLLTKFFREKNIRPTEEVLPYLLRRIERSATAARDLVGRLDAASDDEGRAVTRALARRVLEPELAAAGDEDEG